MLQSYVPWIKEEPPHISPWEIRQRELEVAVITQRQGALKVLPHLPSLNAELLPALEAEIIAYYEARASELAAIREQHEAEMKAKDEKSKARLAAYLERYKDIPVIDMPPYDFGED